MNLSNPLKKSRDGELHAPRCIKAMGESSRQVQDRTDLLNFEKFPLKSSTYMFSAALCLKCTFTTASDI